jgi:hypothetical protein
MNSHELPHFGRLGLFNQKVEGSPWVNLFKKYFSELVCEESFSNERYRFSIQLDEIITFLNELESLGYLEKFEYLHILDTLCHEIVIDFKSTKDTYIASVVQNDMNTLIGQLKNLLKEEPSKKVMLC